MSQAALVSIIRAYAQKSKDGVVVPNASRQLAFQEMSVHNRTGGAIDVGILVKLAAEAYTLGTIDDSATPDFIAGSLPSSTNVVELFSTTDDDGFLVSSRKQIGLVGFTVSQAEAGTPVYEYTYFNGTSYVALTTIETPAAWTATDHLIVFIAPHDWVVGTTVAVGGSATAFNLRVRATTAPSTAVEVNDMWVGEFLDFQEALGDNSALEIAAEDEKEPLVFESLEEFLPYFGTANAANLVKARFLNVG